MKNRIFSLLLAICLLLAVMPFSVAAEQIAVSGTTGDCVWTLDGTTLTISGSGAMADYDEPVEEMSDITIINWYNQPPWYDSDITEIIISEGVTHIGDYAFNSKDYSFEIWDYGDCPGCDTVIPDPIEEKPICDVCAGTFIPYVMGVQEYNSGLAVTSVTIPESVTDIGSNAFIGCDELLVKGYANSYAETFANENGFSFEDLSHICSYTSVTTAPTCSASGYITYICSDCGDTYTVTDETTPLKDHSYKKGVCENCGDIYTTTDFEYTVTNGKITITCYNGFDTLVEIPAYIDGYPVTVIGEQAFLMCSDITDIIIPYTVMTIEDDAFNACSSLSRIDLGNSVTSIGNLAFSGCSSLTSINLPATVSTLGNSIFAYCDNLTYITVAYGNTVFYSEGNCIIESATKTVVAACNKSVIPDYVTAIGKKAFYGCDVMTTVTIPHSVTIINDNAFYGCNQLTSVIFGSGLTRIGNNAFNRCTKLKNIYYCGDYSEWYDISKGSGNTTLSGATFNSHKYTDDYYVEPTCISLGYYITHCVHCGEYGSRTDENSPLGEHSYSNGICTVCYESAFEYTETNGYIKITGYKGNETDIVIPEYIDGYQVTAIGESAFSSCSFENVILPDSIKTIEEEAFSYCSNLESITLPQALNSINYGVFSQCSNLSSINIPDSVTVIEDFAFFACYNLENIKLPDNLTSIGDEAFNGCYSFTSIEIPDSVTDIGQRAFFDCSDLQSVTLPAGITTIKDFTFAYCGNLGTLIIPDSVTDIKECAFLYSDITALRLPHSVKNIGASAFTFKNNSNITVYYCGTQEEWDTIAIDESNTKLAEIQPTLHNYTYRYIGSTCVDHAYYIYTCTYCDDSYTVISSNSSLKEHQYGDWTVVTPPTCTEFGEEEKVCVVCGHADMRLTPATGHSYSDWTDIIPASCTEKGKQQRICATCNNTETREVLATGHNYIGEYFDSTCAESAFTRYTCSHCSDSYDVIDSNSILKQHTFGDWITSATATCTDSGNAYRECTVCGFVEEKITPALGHTFTAEYINSTCKDLAYTKYTCSVCNFSYNEIDENSVLKGHNYKKGVCENCGDIYTTTDFEYTVTNGKITITCYNGFDTLVEIPAYIDGYPVTVIGEQAFLMCSDITDIIIPYTVMTIEDDAFNACSSLSRIDLGNSVTSIGNLAFSGCSSLTSINLPATVSTLGNSIFAYCDNLTYITVAYGNTVFYSEGNCIIESATKTVVAACNKSVIPDYVTAIGKKAFYGCDVMTTVTIPHSVTIINDNAFYGCNQLTSVIFGSGLTRIGNNAFNRCTKLKNIYYCGDYSEWLDISKGSGNTTLSSAKFNSHRYTFSYYIGATCLSYGYSVQECVLCHNTNMIEDIDNGYADHTYEDDYTVDKEPTAFENGSKSRHCIYCSERTDITVIPANSKAHGTCGTGAMWALTEDGVLMISGNGATDDYKLPALAPWYQYAAEIVSLKIESSITRIGNNNFSCLSNLTNAEINNPDTEFGVYAFAKGINLTIHALGGGNVETYAKENGYTIKKPENAIIPLNVSIEQISGYNVTLKALSGYEYSLDGINWQSDNTFTGLLPATAYTFYQRIAEGVYSASVTSDGKTVTTLAISKAAVIESIIGNIATLTPISGYEYSIDGINWQTSNVFVIPMNRVICFYQRKPANGIYAASPASQAVKGITVSAPTVMVSGSAIYIKPVEGCEYGLENVLWQTENVFGEWIVPGESYTVYQRFVNTEGVFAVYDTNGTTVVINGNEFCSDPNATHLVDLRKLLLNSNSNDISADYNGDYTVDLRDLIRLKKHIAGEDVPLGSENGATAGYALYNETAYFEQKNNF